MEAARLEKRSSSSSGCSSHSLSSLEKRRRVGGHRARRPGSSLKQARAAFASHSSNKEVWLRHCTSVSPARKRPDNYIPQGVPLEIVSKAPPPHATNTKQVEEEIEEDVPGLLCEEEDSVIPKLLLEELQRDDAKAVARALERLGSIFKHEAPTKCHQAVHLGAPSMLLIALKKWHHDKRVARHGCHAMFRMIGTYTKHPPQEESSFHLVESFLALGGVEVLLHVLTTFPRAADIQVFGMCALGNMFREGRASLPSRQAAKKLVLEGGVSTIVQAMQDFPHHAKLQEMACWLCARLCFCLGTSTSQAVMKEQALVAVATAVQNHPRNAAIDKQAGNFMATLFDIIPAASSQEEGTTNKEEE